LSATKLSNELGVGQPTLSRWLKDAPTVVPVTKPKPSHAPQPSAPKRPQDWSVDEKLRFVAEAGTTPESELGALLRHRGVHEAQLAEWRANISEALGKPRRASSKATADAKRIAALEKELHRKEKALAEAAALLMLKKKVAELFGDEDDDSDSRKDR
jgi:transposase